MSYDVDSDGKIIDNAYPGGPPIERTSEPYKPGPIGVPYRRPVKRFFHRQPKLRRDQFDQHVAKLVKSGHTKAQATAQVVALVQASFTQASRPATD